MSITVHVPRNPDERLALDVVQSVWPRLSYLRHAPPKLRMEAKIALSQTVWDALCITIFDGPIRPVDTIARTLFGYEVVVNNWPREQVELLIPVDVMRSAA